ncbi:hypothetical protein Pcinc_036229 [Petrolisthes cinctipes]|uniref:Uncharacterized protein n=1 Tax=Petrolisthes cinctipes TaxID=88211 RepID=A0AAE1ENV9_PETCI|nr:hypothetical protein Pcinc_036229 [Petrolisthes cinctipes]
MKIGTHEKNSLLEVLRVVKKVRVPIECGQQPGDDQQKEEDFFTASFNITENNLKLTEGNPKYFFYRGSCDMKVDKNSDDKLNTTAEDPLRSNIKLSLPELTQLPGSHSPGSQRLSNMVSASVEASRESLEPDKKTATTENLTFTQENEDNPGSPCSITPFILTPPQNSCKDRSPSTQDSVCTAMSRCMQAVCVGNPEQVFWQTVRLHLGPPSLHTIHQ